MSNIHQVIDIKTLQTLQKIMSVVEGGFDDILQTFLANSPTILHAMEEAIKANDAKKMGASAHTLKSTCASLGIFPLSELLRTVEKNGREENMVGIEQLFKTITTEYQIVKNHLEGILLHGLEVKE